MKTKSTNIILVIMTLLVSCSSPSQDTTTTATPSATIIRVNHPSITPSPTRELSKATPGRFPSCRAAPLRSNQLSTTPFPIATIRPEEPFPNPPLRDLAEAKGKLVGAAITPWLFADEFYARLLSQQFNLIAAENAMKWEVLHPEPDRYDFSQGDALVSFARKFDMSVFAHVLVWDLQMPAWVTEPDRSRDEWIQILCTHIKTVVSHYRGQVYAWDVVNEAVNADGTLRNSFWMQRIGPDHIAMAFQWAREADPSALLFYNDNGGEGLNARSEAIYQLIKSLKESGIPIDGVGLQTHTPLYMTPSPKALRTNIQRLADLGLEVHISEMDVWLQYAEDSEEDELNAQAETYRRVVEACLAVQSCRAFTTWGISDRFSWVPGWTGKPDAPLLFDDDANPKPAYYAVQEAFSKHP
jgi:endo-1,4-beta-xylanase